jgi:hypothetical protein
MDVKAYREAYEAELAGRAGSTTAAAAALETSGNDLLAGIPTFLTQLADATLTLAVRLAALRALRAALFLGEQFAPHRAEFLDICRKLAQPGVEEPLRVGATEVLAAEKDPGIQAALKRELETQKPALVGAVKALQLLSLDDHANIADLARDVFQKASDLGLKEAALRVLSVDPKSQGLLAQLLEDKSQPKSLRALSATGLNILNPQKFADIAQKIVKDHDDFEDIRASALGALANTPLHQAIRDHTDFLDAVRNLDTKSPLDNLRAAAHRFLTKS